MYTTQIPNALKINFVGRELWARPQVLPLTAAALEEELQRATDELLALDGQRLLSAWLDHVHSSYSSELEAAARLQARRGRSNMI